jgi:hypothetical protein
LFKIRRFAMEKNGSEFMVIKVDTKNGRIVEPPEDEKGQKAEEVSLEAIDKIHRSDNGFKHVATILHAHSSPGCVYIRIGGKLFRICM